MTLMSITLSMRADPTKSVLFDLDGTLADTAPDLGAATNALRAQLGLEPLALEILRPFTSSGVRGMLGAGLGIHAEHADYAAMAERFLEFYAENLCVHTRLYDGIDGLLDALDTAGIDWGIVTNKRSRFTDPLISALDLAHRACCVISGDSAPRPKPAPDPLLLACERAGLEPHTCVYVGDDLRDIQAGHAAGMRTVAAAYGYLGDDEPIERWNADAIIHSPGELLPLVGIRRW